MNYKLPPLPPFDYHEANPFGPDENEPPVAFTAEQMQAYAIAALEQQRQIEAQCVPDGWQLVPKEPTQEMLIAGTYKIAVGASYKAMLASAPPALEVENRNPQASVVRQEPAAWIRPSGKAMLEAGGYCTVYASDGMSNHSTPLYTNPAQQAKPQPLSDEKIQAIVNDTIGIAFKGFSEFARAIEAAHGIQGS